MRRLPLLLLWFGALAFAEDFEFVTPTPSGPMDRLVLRLVDEALRAAGSSVYFVFDDAPGAATLFWGYPEAIGANGALVSTRILDGFGGLLVLHSTEEDRLLLQGVQNLPALRATGLEAILSDQEAWLAFWQRAGLPFRIDNTTPETIRRGQYRVIPLWKVAVDQERSAIRGQPLLLLIHANTDVALFVNPTKIGRTRAETLRATLERGFGRLRETQRLGFLVRQWFLPAFTDFRVQRARLISLR